MPGDVLARLAPIRFGREVCGRLDASERREWWLADGNGGYAGGTIALSLTRRYHGLLVAPLDPPLGRVLLFTKADATVIDADGRRLPLFANRWGSGAIEPTGYLALESFHLDGSMPVWRFAWGDHTVEQRIWMEAGKGLTYVAWRLEAVAATHAMRLSVSLLANGRDHHGETDRTGFAPDIATDGTTLVVRAGDFALHIAASAGSVTAHSGWYEDFDLPIERERGLPARDAHLHVGDAELPLQPGRWVGLAASPAPLDAVDIVAALQRRRAHDREVVERAIAADPVFARAPGWVLRLVLATDLYLIARPFAEHGQSVIAGYPWFADWGRDTMISLPGLCLATGRFDAAKRVLLTFARYVDGGMLPNTFPEGGGTPEYNTADAALWYLLAWRAYVDATGDDEALRQAFPVLAAIVDWHRAGARYGIAVDPADGLLHAGEPGMQLTWMDARIDGYCITPRIGKPVEINALWFNGLRTMAALAERAGRPAGDYRDAALRVAGSFGRFVRPGEAGLYDVIDGPDGADATLRPNQIVALSLPESPLDNAVQRAVLARCGAALVTSYGLRSLAPGERDYRGQYRGGVAERDGGYHQGPVWAWLLGHWALAHHRVHGDAAAAVRFLEPIGDHLADAGLGQVSEIFDGDPPHIPRGAPAQAWSVACTLEAWWRLEHARLGSG
jgi:predicted glycogen debranching enzyme